MGSHFLLQEIFLTQESNPGLPRCRQMLYHLSHQGSSRLGWACVLCPSQVQAAQVMRCLASVVAATYCLRCPCR